MPRGAFDFDPNETNQDAAKALPLKPAMKENPQPAMSQQHWNVYSWTIQHKVTHLFPRKKDQKEAPPEMFLCMTDSVLTCDLRPSNWTFSWSSVCPATPLSPSSCRSGGAGGWSATKCYSNYIIFLLGWAMKRPWTLVFFFCRKYRLFLISLHAHWHWCSNIILLIISDRTYSNHSMATIASLAQQLSGLHFTLSTISEALFAHR